MPADGIGIFGGQMCVNQFSFQYGEYVMQPIYQKIPNEGWKNEPEQKWNEGDG